MTTCETCRFHKKQSKNSYCRWRKFAPTSFGAPWRVIDQHDEACEHWSRKDKP